MIRYCPGHRCDGRPLVPDDGRLTCPGCGFAQDVEVAAHIAPDRRERDWWRYLRHRRERGDFADDTERAR